MIVWGPLVVGVKLTAQLVETAPVVGLVLALPSVQLEAEKVPPLFATLTVLVGAVAEPGVASVTVAVQLVGLPTGTETGVQLTLVVVPCLIAVTPVVPELPSLALHAALPILIVWGPLVVGVKLTAQLVETAPVVGLVLALPSVQLEAEKVPPLFVKLTVPVGAVAEPGVASVTVAVQLVGLPTGTEAGAQLTVVAVACLSVVSPVLPELASCVPSLPYALPIVWAPLVVGVKLTAQLVETAPVVGLVLALPSVQLAAEKVPPLFVKLTVPVGAVAEPGVASVTVAVQLVGLPTGTEAGAQLTVVAVACLSAVTPVVPELPSCVASPP